MKKRRKGLLALWLAFFVTVLSLPLEISAEGNDIISVYPYLGDMNELGSPELWYRTIQSDSLNLNTPLDSQLDISSFTPYAGHIHNGWVLWGFKDSGVVDGYRQEYDMNGTVSEADYQTLTTGVSETYQLLVLPLWKCKYEITHQPLPAEPYISTNEVGTYQWYTAEQNQYDEVIPGTLIADQTTTAFTGGAGTYVCCVTYDDYVLTSDPVTITEHTITKEPSANGSYTLSVNGQELSSSTVDPSLTSALSGQQITVTSIPASGYQTSSITVMSSADAGQTVPVDSDNCFVMPDYPVTVRVAFTMQTFEIALPVGTGYRAALTDGQTAPVSYGTSCNFTVTIADGYTVSDSFAVSANGRTLTGTTTDGRTYTYTIPDITEAQSITVTGINRIPEPEPPAGTDTPGNANTPGNTDTPSITDTPGNTTPPAGTDTPSTGAPVNNGNFGASILSAGVTSLISGTAYRLGSGKWTVAGDNTLYEGGSVFYVTNSGSYDFRPQ